MTNNANYETYMTEEVYRQLNPIERGMSNYEKEYNPNNHFQSNVFSIHLFFVSKAWTNYTFVGSQLGFVDEIQLTLVLENGKWRAINVEIAP